MGKSAELARGASMAADAWGRLDRGVQALGGTPEALHILVRDEGLPLITSIAELLVNAELKTRNRFRLTVDYGKPFEKMVADCNCGANVNADITAEHFPVTGEGVHEYEVILVTFDKRMLDDEVSTELARMGLEDVRIEHLCALAAKYPELQRQFPIAARGSSWVSPLVGCLVYPCLVEWRGGRGLGVVRVRGFWGGRWRFLALRKVKPLAT